MIPSRYTALSRRSAGKRSADSSPQALGFFFRTGGSGLVSNLNKLVRHVIVHSNECRLFLMLFLLQLAQYP